MVGECVTFLESVDVKVFLVVLKAMEPWLLKANSSNHEGTSCCACQIKQNYASCHIWFCLINMLESYLGQNSDK